MVIAAPPLTWRLPVGVRLAFSTAADGDLGDPDRRAAWLAELDPDRAWSVPGQVHGAAIADADVDDRDALMSADGVVARDPGRGLGVLGADCPGLCLAAPDVLGLAHCGWRGCAAGIVAALVRALAERSRHPRERWQAFVGPGIAGTRYEVDAPVLGVRRWPDAALAPTGPGRACLDLTLTIVHDLAVHGVGPVAWCGVCTAADPRLHSYRRQGLGASQVLAAWRAAG